MTIVHLDYETKSEVALDEHGMDRYLSDSSTQVLMAAYAEGNHKPKLWEPHKQPKMPAELKEAIEDPFVIISGWNVTFEKAVTRKLLGLDKPTSEWRDSMVRARYMSLPGSLDAAGAVLGLKEDEAKLKDGKRLITKFCTPAVCSQTGGLFGPTQAAFRDWNTDPDDWELFGQYCLRDVTSERAIDKKLEKFPVPEHEWEAWCLDQKINEIGLPVDLGVVRGAGVIVERAQRELLARIKQLTGLDNPNSNEQVLGWLNTQKYTFGSLGKAFVSRALAGECDLTPLAKEVIGIRQQTSKSSVKKYTSIGNQVSSDGRLRYQFSFGGASRTFRWASRGINLQNLPRPAKAVEKKMDVALDLIRRADYEGIVSTFKDPLEVVTSTLRSSFKAPEGYKLIIADLGSIENRVVGYAARCPAILDVFYKGKDPYLDFAAALYSTPYEQLHAEWKAGDSSKRTYAKPATLAASYRMSGGEELVDSNGDKYLSGLLGYAKAMGVLMTKEDADRAVKLFRETYPEVCQFWYDLERAATKAIRHPGKLFEVGVVGFECVGSKVLKLLLPSGRAMHYVRPTVVATDAIARSGRKYKKDLISHEGKDQKTGVWGVVDIHGGVLCENISQAIARDVLVNGLKIADEKGFHIILHVHDEIGCLEPVDTHLTVKDLCDCMATPVPWAGDALPLAAEGFDSFYYRKG